MARTVNIVEYNPSWPDAFDRACRALGGVLRGVSTHLMHIGSTAIPGMRAKPIIDILLAVKRREYLDQFEQGLGLLGYSAHGEFGIPGRRFYSKGGDKRTHHLHAFELGSPEIGRHIRFRDYLRDFGEEASAYAALKDQLAKRFREDPVGYSDAKSEFIARIDSLAQTDGKRRLQ